MIHMSLILLVALLIWKSGTSAYCRLFNVVHSLDDRVLHSREPHVA
jgi:hypothetical protein